MKIVSSILICLLLIFLKPCNELNNFNDMPDCQGAFKYQIRNVWDDYKSGKYGYEMYYLASGGGWLGTSDIVLYKNNNGAQMIFYQSWGRYKTRQLNNDEIKKFESFITEEKIDSLHDWDTGTVLDGVEYQYMHFSKNNQTTFYMNNPDFDDEGKIYAELVNKFYDFTETGNFEVHYTSDITAENIKILIKNEDYCVESVWKNGDDFRVLIRDAERSNYEHEQLDWYKFENGVVGEKVDEPRGVTMSNPWVDVPDSYKQVGFSPHLNNYPSHEQKSKCVVEW